MTLNFCCLHAPKAGITDNTPGSPVLWPFVLLGTPLPSLGIHLTNSHTYLTQFKWHLLSKASSTPPLLPLLWGFTTRVAQIASPVRLGTTPRSDDALLKAGTEPDLPCLSHSVKLWAWRGRRARTACMKDSDYCFDYI